MKDFPIFDTESGISSLILREIPYRREAYIHIQSVQPEGFWDHLHQCVSFCRMAGCAASSSAKSSEPMMYSMMRARSSRAFMVE